MIARFTDLLSAAHGDRTAVFAFTCYDAESAAGVLTAAAGRPVIILVSAQLVLRRGGDLVVAALLGIAERAASPVCVELDHAHELEAVRAACALGVGAVMADGSHLPVADNAQFVAEARDLAAPLGIAVEAELGAVLGDEEVATPAAAGELTDPAAAATFARETGADCLAVAVGNVHGIYRGRPRLDLPRVRAIAERTGVPLALHGGSGLPATEVRGAVAAGMTKVNINTELRRAYLEATERDLASTLVGARLLDLHGAQVEAAGALAERKLAMLEGAVALGGER